MWVRRMLVSVGVFAAVLGPPAAAGQAVPAPPVGTLVFPPKDRVLQAELQRVLQETPFRRFVQRGVLSVALVDLSDPGVMRYAGVDDNRMRYAASLPKIAILLGVFDQIERGNLEYTPQVRQRVERMIRRSDNPASTALIETVGFEAIARVLRDPRYQLYGDSRNGGLWVGRDYGGGRGLWRRDPLHEISHGATARQVARFFVMLERGELVSQQASAEMKRVLGNSALNHKFVRGLRSRPGSLVYRKSGTWRTWHADAALVERDGKTYVAVALLESALPGNVFSQLIVRLDDLIHRPGATAPAAADTTTSGREAGR